MSENWQKMGKIRPKMELFYIFFVRSGYVYSDSTLNHPGYAAHYWSRSSHSSTNAFYLAFYDSGVYPSRNYYRYIGLPLRCLYAS